MVIMTQSDMLLCENFQKVDCFLSEEAPTWMMDESIEGFS